MADAFFVPFFSSLNFNTHGHNMSTDQVDRQLQNYVIILSSCGFASFGAYLLLFDISAMSLTSNDVIHDRTNPHHHAHPPSGQHDSTFDHHYQHLSTKMVGDVLQDQPERGKRRDHYPVIQSQGDRDMTTVTRAVYVKESTDEGEGQRDHVDHSVEAYRHL
ncbi:hypothetical protein F8388_019437 [Cannabis sativa]|uniref:Uncharacterized protein n=1 Tax=Cannabis sativa TaxID=3483 RepID=A0A7J6FFZ8_CANSA|nr:hypothetical protein F8388_019437 [Cannabis sativa]